GIDFKKMGIETNEAGIPRFDPTTMQIENTSFFITGDVTKERQLLHEAADEGYIAGYNAVHAPQCFRRRAPLAIVFTDPNIAVVGKNCRDLSQRSDLIIVEACCENQGLPRIMSNNMV